MNYKNICKLANIYRYSILNSTLLQAVYKMSIFLNKECEVCREENFFLNMQKLPDASDRRRKGTVPTKERISFSFQQ